MLTKKKFFFFYKNAIFKGKQSAHRSWMLSETWSETITQKGELQKVPPSKIRKFSSLIKKLLLFPCQRFQSSLISFVKVMCWLISFFTLFCSYRFTQMTIHQVYPFLLKGLFYCSFLSSEWKLEWIEQTKLWTIDQLLTPFWIEILVRDNFHCIENSLEGIDRIGEWRFLMDEEIIISFPL